MLIIVTIEPVRNVDTVVNMDYGACFLHLALVYFLHTGGSKGTLL